MSITVYASVLGRALSHTEVALLKSNRVGDLPDNLTNAISTIKRTCRSAPRRVLNNPLMLAVYAKAQQETIFEHINKVR